MKKQTLKKQKLPTKTFLGQKIGKSLEMYNSVVQSRNQSMALFLIGNRKNIALISQDLSLKLIVKTLFLVFSILKQNGHILVVNTNPDFVNLISNFALKTNKIGAKISYCNSKWVGGTLTNWNQISKSIVSFYIFSKRFGEFIKQNNIHFPKYKKLKKCFEGYTSLFTHAFQYPRAYYLRSKQGRSKQSVGKFNFVEQVVEHEKKLKNTAVRTSTYYVSSKSQKACDSVTSSNFTILNHTLKKPNLLFVLNPNDNHIVLNEARLLKIPVIALTDTNTDISLVTYPIPVNDQSAFFIHFYLSWILRLIKMVQKKGTSPTT